MRLGRRLHLPDGNSACMSVEASAGLRCHTGSGRVEVATQQVKPMKLPRIILAAVAVSIAAPAISNAQGTWPGLPTTNAPAISERHDDGVCGLTTLRGTYVFAASGFNIVGGLALPKAIVEVVEFNGDGTLSVPAVTLSVNGVIARPPASIGTYTVEDDCSGTITFNGPTYDIFVLRDAEAIRMIQTNSNSVFQGTATRTSRGRGRR